MRLDELNTLPDDSARAELLRCCGSTRWARAMTAARPFATADAMLSAADAAWSALGPDDWLEAFRAHPRIGETVGAGGHAGARASERPAHEASARHVPESGARGAESQRPEDCEHSRERGDSRWSAHEQAGVRDASQELRDRLARANDRYEARFGYIFIVCATGRSADEMLAMLERRLTNEADAELQTAAEEQRKIMRLRIAKMMAP